MIRAIEFEVVSGRRHEPKPPEEKIRSMIAGSDVFVAVLSRRDKLEGVDEWKTSDWLLGEIGMAYQAGKPGAFFVEDGVAVGGLQPRITEYVRFDRGNLSACAPQVVQYLVSLRLQVAPRADEPGNTGAAKALFFELDRCAAALKHDRPDFPWRFSYFYGNISGANYNLAEDVQEALNDAHRAIDEVGEAATDLGRLVGPFSLLRKKRDPAPSPQEIQAATERLSARKQEAEARIEKASRELFAVAYPGFMEALKRFQQAQGEEKGRPKAGE